MRPGLTIRREQLATFEERALGEFVDKVLPVIVEHWPGLRGAGDDVLRERVQRSARRALAEGMTTEGQLLRWVNVTFVLGDDFAEDPDRPEVRAVLESAHPAQAKLEELVRIAAAEARRRG